MVVVCWFFFSSCRGLVYLGSSLLVRVAPCRVGGWRLWLAVGLILRRCVAACVVTNLSELLAVRWLGSAAICWGKQSPLSVFPRSVQLDPVRLEGRGILCGVRSLSLLLTAESIEGVYVAGRYPAIVGWQPVASLKLCFLCSWDFSVFVIPVPSTESIRCSDMRLPPLGWSYCA